MRRRLLTARWRNGTGWQLFKYVAGTATQLGSTVTAAYSAGVTHTAKLTCNGSAISLHVDGVLTIGPIADTAITAAGFGGILAASDSDSDGVHLDNFSIDTLTTGDATVAGATLTGTSSISTGGATGSVSGTFISDAMENNTGAGLLVDTSVTWTWWQGSIGSTPASLTHGAGMTNAGGILTLSGLPLGAGFLLARTADSAGVYYQPGTVT